MSHVQGGVMSPGGQTTATAYTIPFGSSVQVGVPMSAVTPLSSESQRGLNFSSSPSVLAGNSYGSPNTATAYSAPAPAPSAEAFLTEMQTKYGSPNEGTRGFEAPVQPTMSATSSSSLNRAPSAAGAGVVVGSICREEMGQQADLMESDLDYHREMARQQTIDFNLKHGVGAVKGATSISKQDGSRGVIFDLDGSLAAGTTMDHVQRRRLLNAVSAVPEKPKYRAHHAPTNVNNVVRNLALTDKAAPRGTKLGTDIQPDIPTSTGVQYQVSVVQAKAPAGGAAAPNSYGGTGINAAVRNRAVGGSGNLAFGDQNIIREELNKEDQVLHPYRTLDDHRGFTRAETQEFQARQWSPLR